MSNYPFRNVETVGEPLVSDQIESNLTAYLQWNLLGVNAFGNVTYGASGNYGGNASRLRLAENPNYTKGQVWESFRKQWIWQSGTYRNQPIQVSGVKVNGVFCPSTGVGPYAHTIDYTNGRVIFDSPIATNATVLAEYSYNYYQIYTADNPNWMSWQRNSFRIDDADFLTYSSGTWNKPPEQRIQCPAIVVEVTPNFNKIPFNIGSHTHWHSQEVKLHFLTETRPDLKWIVDVVGNQFDTVLNMFDKGDAIVSGVYPINMIDGTVHPSIRNYPDIVNNFPLHKEMQLTDFRSFSNNEYIANNIDSRTIPFYFTTLRFMAKTLLN